MSADNGVYVLITKDGKGQQEYRVAEAASISNLFLDKNGNHNPMYLNEDYAIKIFGQSKIHNSRETAAEEAQMLYEEMSRRTIVEYGISFIDQSDSTFPSG